MMTIIIIIIIISIILLYTIAPSISTATLLNINGNLTVSWELLHTGGTILNTLSVQCQSDEGLFNASGDPLAMIIECSINEECMSGSVSIGPVTTGMNYSCVVTTDNNIGEDEMMTNNILTNTGELLY